MRFSCSICQDLFDGCNPLVAAPCGHVFHTTCVSRWMNQSKTCPECRTAAKQKDLLKLYFHSTTLDETTDVGELVNHISELNAKLRDSDGVIRDYRNNQDTLKAYIAKSEADVHELTQKVYFYEGEIVKSKLNLKTIKNLEAKVLKLESHNQSLMAQLESLDTIKHIINDSKEDVELILKDITESSRSETNKTLAASCSIMKRELSNLIVEKNEMRATITKLQKKLGLRTESEKKANTRIIELESRISHLERRALGMSSSKVDLDVSSVQGHATSTPCSSKQVIKRNPDLTPITVDFNSGKKACLPITWESDTDRMPRPVLHIKQNGSVQDYDSITRTGYDGLGGHKRLVTPSKDLKALKFRKIIKK